MTVTINPIPVREEMICPGCGYSQWCNGEILCPRCNGKKMLSLGDLDPETVADLKKKDLFRPTRKQGS